MIDIRLPVHQTSGAFDDILFANPGSPGSFIQTYQPTTGIDFQLPAVLGANEPPEARGLRRDQVRLMVSQQNKNFHTDFGQLPEFLSAGDVLVINTSATRSAAANVIRSDATPFELHFSNHLGGNRWAVELRQFDSKGSTVPYFEAQAGDEMVFPIGGKVELLAHYGRQGKKGQEAIHTRLWLAEISLPMTVDEYLENFGFPIRYSHVQKSWPSSFYQTIYADEIGSAEMPSAGRAFSPEVVTRLVSKGVLMAPLVLHAGVSSLEEHEPPFEEYYSVPEETAWLVNEARQRGKRIIAVGTTAVRALESVAAFDGIIHEGEGWTSLVITPERGLWAVDGLLTGFHEPRSSHLWMLLALMDRNVLQAAYDEAIHKKYLWHEFGDLHLILT